MSAALLSPAARRDLLAAVRWIAKDDPAAARALRDAVANAAERLDGRTHVGSRRPDLADERYRFFTPTGFPYLIVYNADRLPPLIVRILHGARDLLEVRRDL